MGYKVCVGVDVDGVLAVFEKNFAEVLRSVGCQVEFPLDSPDFPDVWDWMEKWGATPEQVKAAWAYVKQSPNFWFRAQKRANTHMDISRLRLAQSAGHDVYFITNRPGDSSKPQTEDWLISRGWNLPTVLVTRENTKHLVTDALGLDAYIDDKPQNLGGHTPHTRLFLFDQPYNRHIDSSQYTRVKTVSEMLDILGV